MRLIWLGILLHVGIAILPLRYSSEANPTPHNAPVWPTAFEGRPLYPLALTEQERGFQRGFPGHVARFTDGSHEIVMRSLHRASRRLHPAADCLKAVGYQVTPRPIRVGTDGHYWGCVLAQRPGKSLQVCERIYDGNGNSWSDVSSWYWAAMLGKTNGPWQSMTIARPVSAGSARRG